MDGLERPAGQRMPAGHIVYEDGSVVFDEFEPGDPRRGPHSLSVQNDAEAWAVAPKRWHQRRRVVDWFAIRLAYGRGYPADRAGQMFGVETSTARRRAKEEKWVSPMAACDRYELAVLVWLAGWKRIDPGDAESLDALKKASEYRLMAEPKTVWREKESQGEPLKYKINDEIPDNAFFSEDDPKREERRAVIDELEAELRQLEAQWRAGLPGGTGADVPDETAAALDRLGEVAAGMGEAGDGEEGVEGAGAPGAASA